MKTSAGLFLTDILPHKRKIFNKVVKNNVFGKDSTNNEVLTELKKSGVEGIELFLPSFAKSIDLNDFRTIKKIIEQNKLRVFSVHQSLRFFSKTAIDEVSELFVTADLLGAEVIVLHLNLAGKKIFDQQYIDKIHELQKHYNIKVGFENREKMFGPFRAKYTWEAESFASLIRKNDFYITLDTTHLAQTGSDIVAFFKKNKDRIVNIHISDYKEHIFNSTLRPFRYKHLALGKGELPISKFLQTLREEKYQGLVTMEIHTNLQGLCESARIISQSARS